MLAHAQPDIVAVRKARFLSLAFRNRKAIALVFPAVWDLFSQDASVVKAGAS
jgi:hypothetical protein